MRESITTLPTEIIEEILSYLSHNDVSALTQTSKRLWQVAAPRLRSGIPLLTGERARACVQRLAEDPHRAAQILEIHLPRLMPRRKPFPWPFTTIGRVLVATIGRVVPLPFAPVEAYPELRRVFTDALCNLTSLRILTVHSCQRAEIWDCRVIIPSLREIYIYPGAESWFLWHWAKRQHTLTTVQNRWKHADHRWRYPYLPNHRGPLALPYLHTLITDPEGATEVLPKSVVSDLTIQGLTKPSRFIEYPVDVTDSHSVDYEPPFLYNIVRSNERTPLRRITLSGTVDGICSVLRELQSRDSLPPRVRGFFELGYNESERDLVCSSLKVSIHSLNLALLSSWYTPSWRRSSPRLSLWRCSKCTSEPLGRITQTLLLQLRYL